MVMIGELVKLVTQRLGIPEETAEQAVGVVLSLLKDPAVNASAANSVFGSIPGAEDLANRFADGGSSSGGGLVGGLLNQGAGLLGGQAGDMLSAAAAFKNTGLSTDQLTDMVPLVQGFFSEKAGGEVATQLFSSIPALKSLLS
ncbi:MAG: DUF2780 domain-containing protein [Pseudomonadota bacterium]